MEKCSVCDSEADVEVQFPSGHRQWYCGECVEPVPEKCYRCGGPLGPGSDALAEGWMCQPCLEEHDIQAKVEQDYENARFWADMRLETGER